MSYAELTSWMFGLERFGIKLGLENITEFLSRIGDPHKSLRSIHVTGTNGKGSVCAMVSSILQERGLKVGLYTSPHLVDFRERISVSGRDIPEDGVVRIAQELRSEMEAMANESEEKQLTFFEFTTALAFRYFQEQKVDIVVAEVGMGGRLDATNVLQPDVGAITRIGLEHTNYLGKTIPDIAREKAGIIKSGMSLVTSVRDPDALSVIEAVCRMKEVHLMRLGRDFDIAEARTSADGTTFDYIGSHELCGLKTHLLGKYQAENAATAIAIVEALGERGVEAGEEAIRKGLLRTRWPGRLDIVSRDPLLVLDGSHNPDGVATTVSVLRDLRLTPLTFVLACMEDKDAAGIVRALAPTAARLHVTQVSNKRALSLEKLAEVAKKEFDGEVRTHRSSAEAIETALREYEGKGVCVIGSLYLVGESMRWLRDRSGQLPLSHKV